MLLLFVCMFSLKTMKTHCSPQSLHVFSGSTTCTIPLMGMKRTLKWLAMKMEIMGMTTMVTTGMFKDVLNQLSVVPVTWLVGVSSKCKHKKNLKISPTVHVAWGRQQLLFIYENCYIDGHLDCTLCVCACRFIDKIKCHFLKVISCLDGKMYCIDIVLWMKWENEKIYTYHSCYRQSIGK